MPKDIYKIYILEKTYTALYVKMRHYVYIESDRALPPGEGEERVDARNLSRIAPVIIGGSCH